MKKADALDIERIWKKSVEKYFLKQSKPQILM